jgi:hypothetical protein
MMLQTKTKVLAAAALSALTIPQAAARADDVATEIRLLKEQVKQLEPLKARLAARSRSRQPEARTQGNAAPGPRCRGATGAKDRV